MSATAVRLAQFPPNAPILRRLRRNWLLVAMVLIFAAFAIVGLFASELAPRDANQQNLIERLRPPAWQDGGSWDHPLGTDGLGRDQLSRLILGTRISLAVVALAIPAALAIGVFVGLLAGYRSGSVGLILMRVVDVQLALPAILFAVLLAAKFGPGLSNVLFVIVVWNWAGFARVVRAEVLSLRDRDFITAARSIGGTDRWIVTRHILPNIASTVLVLATLDISTVVLAEASLSFLGVGVPPGTPSWGGMISDGRAFLTVGSWLVWVPGVAILTLAITGNLLGDTLRDALDATIKR